MANDGDKFITDAKFLIALWENSATNVKRCNIIDCIENGANVNERFSNNNNNTPLHIAVIKGDREVVKILLKYGAKANNVNDEGKTALQLAKELPERKDIADLLRFHEEPVSEKAAAPVVDSLTSTTAVCRYKKRPGTANVRGQLYETKLLTLIYLRAFRCRHLTQFYLGTNLDEIGDMDDVCLRFRTVNDDYVVFLQAKHKQDIVKGRVGIEDLWRTSGDFSLLKYFTSYRKIRDKFSSNSDNELFSGKYEEMKRFYVIYTTLKDEIECTRKKPAANDEVMIDLIATGKDQNIFQLKYDEQYIQLFTKAVLTERIRDMGRKLFKLIQDNKHDLMFCDEHIHSFHVLLAQKVIKVTEVNAEGCRTGTFREEFFSSNEELLIVLRETLYKEAAKINNLSNEETYVSIMKISVQPGTDTISKLIGNIVTYDSNTNTLKLDDRGDENIAQYQWLLDSLQIPQSVVNEAFEIAGRRKLCSLTFNLPVEFGNLDITIKKKKVERRLEYLANKIADVINESADAEGNVVIREGIYATNKCLTAGELAINGGIAGAVGNLLVADDNNKLKVNLNVDTLSENAKTLLSKLQEKVVDLQKYRFVIDNDDFPRLSLHATQYEKGFVTDFLNNLYFYMCQAKEDQLEEIGARELQEHQCSDSFSKAESRIRSNALFLKVHNEIQIWWMTDQTAIYLTRNTFEYIFRDFSNKGLLTFLNFIYLNEMYDVGLEYNSDAIEVLSICVRDTRDVKMIVIHTDVHLLTCHKLVQCLSSTEDYIFLDINYLCQMSSKYLQIVTDELVKTNINNVVIICEDITKYNDLILACGTRKVILVTSNNNVPTNECILVRDDRINLTDMTDASQSKVLQTQFTYQGVEVTFAEVFDEEMKHLMDSKILEKIINKEYITLGQTLMLSTYDEIKHYYVPRTLQRNKKSHDYTSDTLDVDFDNRSSSSESDDDYMRFNNEPSKTKRKFSPITLIDHHKISRKRKNKETFDVILIIDTPGMGKSTLLTHLSLETKKRHPQIWIQRINLIDHTKQFHEWYENKIKVDSIEALKFVCKIVMSRKSVLGNVRVPDCDINISLDIINNKIIRVDREEQNGLDAFEMDMFLYCFNEGRIVFLFDGFDEVCPHYKREVTQLLKYLARRSSLCNVSAEDCEQTHSEQCVWITSRPYNDLRETLEKEFGESYTLQPFSYRDIRIYFETYMARNLDLSTLNSNQLKNINGFFEYMNQFDLYYNETAKDVALVNIPLHSVYAAAVEYFKSEIKRSHVTDDNLIYVRDWNIEVDELAAWLKHLYDYERFNDVITLSGVPLHVYIAIHYFQSQIKDTSITGDKELMMQWDLDMNAFAFYDRFIETKLKTIRFQEKNCMDIYNPDVKMTYEKEKKEFLDKHKKLAFYSVGNKELFTTDELDGVKEIIRRMESGEEKTGLVDRIVDGEPRFVHYTFAEYFAVEHILDYLKSSELTKKERMLDYIIKNMVFQATKGILNLFDLKIKFDSEFAKVMNTSEESLSIFKTLILQSSVEYPDDICDDYVGNLEDLTATALDKVVSRGMMYFAAFLIDAIISIIDETNMDVFMTLIQKGTFFKSLIVKNQDELVGKILDCIRKFDASKIDDLFPYKLFDDRIHSRSTNEEFIESYHQKLFQNHYVDILQRQYNRRINYSHLSLDSWS